MTLYVTDGLINYFQQRAALSFFISSFSCVAFIGGGYVAEDHLEIFLPLGLQVCAITCGLCSAGT